MTIDPGARATPASDEGRVLMHVETGRLCAINAMGSRIWTEIAAGRSFDEIVASLAAEYARPPARVAADVRDFLAHLVRHRFVRDEEQP
jgi:hypothetical protein